VRSAAGSHHVLLINMKRVRPAARRPPRPQANRKVPSAAAAAAGRGRRPKAGAGRTGAAGRAESAAAGDEEEDSGDGEEEPAAAAAGGMGAGGDGARAQGEESRALELTSKEGALSPPCAWRGHRGWGLGGRGGGPPTTAAYAGPP
jgi:hypothetical protein